MLQIRQKYNAKNRLSPVVDARVWKMEISKLSADLDFSIKKVKVLVDVLKELATNCLNTKTILEATIADIKLKLQAEIKKESDK